MTSPSPRGDDVPQASARTPVPFPSSAIRIVAAVVTLTATAALVTANGRGQSVQYAATSALIGVPAPEWRVGSSSAAIVDLQRQVHDLRSNLLEEREQRVARLQAANGYVLVVLGLLIVGSGLWTHAKFRAIAREARIGAARARALAAGEPNLIPPPSALPAAPSLPPDPLPRLLRASAVRDARPAAPVLRRVRLRAAGDPAALGLAGHAAGTGATRDEPPEAAQVGCGSGSACGPCGCRSKRASRKRTTWNGTCGKPWPSCCLKTRSWRRGRPSGIRWHQPSRARQCKRRRTADAPRRAWNCKASRR